MKMVFRVKDSVQPEETVSVKLTGIELTDEVPIEGTGDTDYEQIELGDKTWVATVPIPKSSDAMLKTLSVTGYDIDFTPGTRKYYITVPTEVYRVEIEAEANHPKASVDIQNTTLTAGEQTRIKIVVTAEDGSTRTYSVYVTREAPETQPPVPSSDCTLKSLTVVGAELAFAPDKTQYSLEVPFETAELSISAEANDAAATVEVKNTALIAGQTVTVQVVVTAEDGTTRTYHLHVTRAAEETLPKDTLPEDTTPEDTTPEDTNPEDTDPAGTGSEETNPETRPSGNTSPVGGDDDTDQKIFWLNAIYIIILVGCLMVIAILVVMLVIYRRMNNSSEH
jgi:stress response protein YsnF